VVGRTKEMAPALVIGILANEDSGRAVQSSGIGDRRTDGDSGGSEDESEKLHCDCVAVVDVVGASKGGGVRRRVVVG
jgi:hypothetical protein